MELELPYWTSMNITESMSNWWINEIPNLNTLVTSTSCQVRTCWMEINSGDPIFMAFTSHDIFLVFQVPNFPGAVITSSGNNLLLGMKGHSTNTFWMSINRLGWVGSLIKIVEWFRQVWIWSCVFWPWSILSFNGDSSLSSFSSHSLLFHAGVYLFLNFLLVIFHLLLNFNDSLLHLILF